MLLHSRLAKHERQINILDNLTGSQQWKLRSTWVLKYEVNQFESSDWKVNQVADSKYGSDMTEQKFLFVSFLCIGEFKGDSYVIYSQRLKTQSRYVACNREQEIVSSFQLK